VGEYREAQDILQEVWLQLYQSLGSLRPHVSIKAWLITVARYRSLDTLRCKRLPSFSEVETGHEEHEAVSIDEIPDTCLTPEELAERCVLQPAVQRAIQALPQAYRWVVLLHAGEYLKFSPDWTNPAYAQSKSQDLLQLGQTDTTRCLHGAGAYDTCSGVSSRRDRTKRANDLECMVKDTRRGPGELW
jgi:RNA polymerase sigma factor (sigma-70 family)